MIERRGWCVSELTISYGEVLVRLLLTAALCGVIGFERETRDKSAGFRTHILLGLGAALFTMVSAIESGGRGIRFDPTRIAAQIVTGIGFLGAGAIIRQGVDIRGLTTAASLWAAAAIGMAAGGGYYFGATVTTVVVVVVLYVLREIRNAMLARFGTDFGVLTADYSEPGRGINEVTETLESHGLEVRSLDVELEGGRSRYTLQLRIPPRRGVQEALGEVSALPGVERVSVTGLREVE